MAARIIGNGVEVAIDDTPHDKLYKSNVVGTRVRANHANELISLIVQAISSFKPGEKDTGQYFIALPDEACSLVESGVAPRTRNGNDYHDRLHRGHVEQFLKRGAVSVRPEGVSVVVYTTAAFKADPDVDESHFVTTTGSRDGKYVTHVLVDIIAYNGPKPSVSPWRFIANLAGGNNAYLAMSGDEIRDLAKAVQEYHEQWCVIADEVDDA